LLYFDHPNDPQLRELEDNPKLATIPCTDEFWCSIGIDPTTRFTRRQNAALNHAYQNLSDEWLLNLDADELVYFSGESITDRLAKVFGDVTSICVATVEHALPQAAGTWFRVPMPRSEVNRHHGEDADFFSTQARPNRSHGWQKLPPAWTSWYSPQAALG
jgi:hypothetical protein